ncbi:MAG: zf-TFIIB domain-containing protein [Candidatus Hydrogenedentota bacterium]
MFCPVCRKQPMLVLEYEQVEVDYCEQCRGVWLDRGEVELLFGNAEACAEFLTLGSPAAARKGEKPRRCPECGRKMTKESTEGHVPISFDHCPRCGGMWFDRGELDRVLNQPEALAAGVKVGAFLRGVFGREG